MFGVLRFHAFSFQKFSEVCDSRKSHSSPEDFHIRVQVKGDEMGKTCSLHWNGEMHVNILIE
jgi:hypothetical protein